MTSGILATHELRTLIETIMDRHHAFMRTELPALENEISLMVARQSAALPELFSIQQMFQDLRDDLLAHMDKEEQILFPYVAGLEQSAAAGVAPPHACFPAVGYPIRVMLAEHDRATAILGGLKAATGSYTAAPNFSPDDTRVYQRLAALDADLREHIRIENDLLFPAAVRLEERIGK